jgi:hypothetical protein
MQLGSRINASWESKVARLEFFAGCFTFHDVEDDIACVAGAAFGTGIGA